MPSAFEEYYEFREKLTESLVQDLIGPRLDDAERREEIIDDMPLTRYAAGILYARKSGTIDPVQDHGEKDEDDENGFADPPIALALLRYPSSMGLTFAVDPVVAPKILIRVQAARYVCLEEGAPADEQGEEANEDAATGEAELDPQTATALARRRERPKSKWQRAPIEIAPVELDVTKPFSGRHSGFNVDGLQLFCRVREPDNNGHVAVTVVLLNEQQQPEKELGDAFAVFQAQIEVTAKASNGAFVERPTAVSNADDADLRSYRLLYRHAREFATGHGCSVRWEKADPDAERADLIATTWAPRHELLLADSNPTIQLPALGMRWLAVNERETVTAGLDELCAGYDQWINKRESEIPALSLDVDRQHTAQEHLAACREAGQRIRNGVQKLREDDYAWRAFQLANQAMMSQRARTVWLKAGKPAAGPQENDEPQWRPFQLAFILLCLEGIADPHSSDRDKADLLWFPTGGGKTEAYLGLIAFTVFLRRLKRHARGQNGGGVTALMRYTLRLLTLQQFERATLLICCLEDQRRRIPELGKEPITIGLWLGAAATPNNLEDSRAALNKLRQGIDPEEGNPVQILGCPWCGAALDVNNYYISPGKQGGFKRMVVSCRQDGCDFKDGLPVHLVDEDVYNHRPTLVIATVDKFAGMPWRGEETAALFNHKTSKHETLPPPELIVQDELHLISGPLGTLTGLYETAIDMLCEEQGKRPKVIASTATIRRSKQQGRGLFNREMHQFPPAGLDARDSYFAVEAPREGKGTRLYIGLMAPGVSHTTLLVRTYAALLQNAAELPGSDAARDPYWTLVGYFNSLRVLGGARMQVQDDVEDRMKLIASAPAQVRELPDDSKIELTSRAKSGAVRDYLKAMTVSLPDKKALSVILATNMISVGVDIDRLGLMAVMGQPQATSEYIQATSRVGRQFPGLVCILFNAARSRDRSHYESFVAYHSALYRQVEATSVTPFSARARDRALHAVLITLARQQVLSLRPNDKAEDVANFVDALNRVKDRITARVLEVTGRQKDADETAKHLDDIILKWRSRADAGKLKYRANSPAESLLYDAAETHPYMDDGFATLWSLRDVDQETNLYFWRIWEDPAQPAAQAAANQPGGESE